MPLVKGITVAEAIRQLSACDQKAILVGLSEFWRLSVKKHRAWDCISHDPRARICQLHPSRRRCDGSATTAGRSDRLTRKYQAYLAEVNVLDQPRTLTIIVGGGLCNRLKPIFSGMAVAARTDRELRIMWSADLDVQPDEPDQHVHHIWPGTWADLFATPLVFVGEPETRQIMAESPEWQDLSNYDNPVVDFTDMRQHIVRMSWRFIRLDCDPAIDCHLEPHPASLLFGADIIKRFELCKPADRLQRKIDNFATAHDIGPDSWAVHIRSQHSWCKRFQWHHYRDLIDRELQHAQPNRIFLSSDNKEYEDKLLRIYQQMVAFPKLSHECVPSLESGDAVADLFLLARAGTIMGTTASTFVHTAWFLAGCRSRFVPLY